jgi:hypothetical protein
MALTAKSLFLYGFTVDASNCNLDFRVVALETPRQAVLKFGYYSLTGLLTEIVRAMTEKAPTFVFTATANRTFNNNTENRVTIATTGSHLELLFASGPNNASDLHALIGFADTDQTGFTTYTGSLTTGTAVVNDFRTGFNFIGPDSMQKVFGSVNISANGDKEAIVFQLQEFFQVQFKYEPQSRLATDWKPLWRWLIQQRMVEFTPEITSPGIFYEATLETSSYESKGLGFQMKEMLPNFPQLWDTGLMIFRKKVA